MGGGKKSCPLCGTNPGAGEQVCPAKGSLVDIKEEASSEKERNKELALLKRLLKYLARPGRVKMGREVEQSLGQKSDLWAPHHHHHNPHHHHQRDRDSAVLGEEIRSVGHKAGKKSDLLCS